MRIPPQLTRLLSDDVMPTVHPVDQILKEIVILCVDESESWEDATLRISHAFAAITERIDVVQGIVVNAVSQLHRT
jgi:hypothetical protein